MIASNLPGLADLIEPDVTGRIVPPESPQRLAEAMEQMAHAGPRTDLMGRAAGRFVQPFDWRGIAMKHLELYQDLTALERPARPFRARIAAPVQSRVSPMEMIGTFFAAACSRRK